MECWPFQKQHQTSTVQVCFAVGFLLKIEIVFKNVCGGERTYRDACLMWLIICLFYLDQYDETFNLSSSDNDVKVHSAIARSDLLGVAATDLPYVFQSRFVPRPLVGPVAHCTYFLPIFLRNKDGCGHWRTSWEKETMTSVKVIRYLKFMYKPILYINILLYTCSEFFCLDCSLIICVFLSIAFFCFTESVPWCIVNND